MKKEFFKEKFEDLTPEDININNIVVLEKVYKGRYLDNTG